MPLKGWPRIAMAALLLLAAGVLAHLHVAAQVYHPVVRLDAPDGVVMTALQAPGLRLSVESPPALARETCEFVARDMVKRGYRSAVCIPASGAQK